MRKNCFLGVILSMMVINSFGREVFKEVMADTTNNSPKTGIITIKSTDSASIDLNSKEENVLPASDSGLSNIHNVVMVLRDKEEYMESQKKNSATTIDFVSGESMRKNGDIDIASAVSNVVGVSMSGDFINVRGLGDRFIRTTINGSVIPTLDPLTNKINLDIFSTNIVDNVTVNKTGSPDLKGDWAGGYLSINTKRPTEKLSVNVETSVGYNPQTTFQNIVSATTSPTDWLGFDGNRDRNNTNFVPVINYPISQRDELFALGLGSYFKTLGITSTSPASAWTDTDFKLGLVQLGLLSRSQFNNSTAVAAAEAKYNQGPYHGEAFDIINANAVKISQSMPNTWNTIKQKALPSFYQGFNIGNQIKVFGRPLGLLTGFQYSSFLQYSPNSLSYPLYNAQIGANGKPTSNDTVNEVFSEKTNSWSALFHVDYKFNRNNKVSLLFMPNIVGQNTAEVGINTKALNTPAAATENIYQLYESRRQMVYQYQSEHYIPGPKLKLDLNASYTHGSSNVPDLRDVDMPLGINKNGAQVDGDRTWQYLSDNVLDTRLSAELPIGKQVSGLSRKFRFGTGLLRNDKRSDDYNYYINDVTAQWFVPGNEASDPFSIDKFAIQPYTISGVNIHAVERSYVLVQAPVNHNFGYTMVKSGFAMLDYAFNAKLKFSGGLRIEQSSIFWDVDKFDSLGLAPNDPRRTGQLSGVINNPVNINTINYLPSANLVYKLKKDSLSPIFFRLNFGQTVGRPSLREVADMNTYDNVYQSFTQGNPNLKTEQINNYDARFEFYFKTGDYISVSGFYKEIKNNIEFVSFGGGTNGLGYTWQNNPNNAWVKGIELDARKKIFKNIDLGVNLTLADSRTSFTKLFPYQSGGYLNAGIDNRPMFGQAPYVVNGILNYTSEKIGLSSTLIYNIQGTTLVTEGGTGIPNIYQMPRNQVDLMFSKSIGKHFIVRFKLKNILNAPYVQSYKFAEGYLLNYSKYTYGTNYILTLIYKL
jgi:outer membrane receptor protein involved in Fe transport